MIDAVTSLVLGPQVVSQAPQHFRSSKKQYMYGYTLQTFMSKDIYHCKHKHTANTSHMTGIPLQHHPKTERQIKITLNSKITKTETKKKKDKKKGQITKNTEKKDNGKITKNTEKKDNGKITKNCETKKDNGKINSTQLTHRKSLLVWPCCSYGRC